MLSEVLRAGRTSTARLSPLSTPDSFLICYRYLGGRRKLTPITELFSTYMEPLCGVSRGKTGETDTGNALRVLVKDVVRRGVPGIVNANKQEQQHRSANEEQG
jgi:hypothetical protein